MSLETWNKLMVARQTVSDRADAEIKRVKNGEYPWIIYDSTLTDYLDSFSNVLPPEGIKAFLFHLTEKKQRKLHALDIAGQGKALMELKNSGIDHVTAVTLVDFRRRFDKIIDTFKGLKVIAGDISSGQTWSKMNKDGNGYDLIVCRPVGALEILGDSTIMLAVFNKMYQKLNIDGLLLTQIPHSILRKFGTDWIEKLSQTPGLIIRYDDHQRSTDSTDIAVISIIRTSDSPPNLHFLKKVYSTPITA